MKKIFDIIASFFGLILLSPVYLTIAFMIKWNDRKSPVLFHQQRVGQHGKLFTMYKFRTMYEHQDGSSISIAGESRITPLGAKLRHYKLDELPELWNVLKGDMSFVGPRPDVPGYADMLEGENRQILKLKPGITGPASLKYRREEELLATVSNPKDYNDRIIFPDKTRLNLYYFYHYSFWTDMKIIFCTVLNRKMLYNGEEV